MSSTIFTIYFDNPFWIGVYQTTVGEGVWAARHVFGDEPTGPALQAFVLSGDDDRMVERAQAGHCRPSTSRRGVETR